MTKIYRCKLHDKHYTVCRTCQHQYCETYWAACPRCAETRADHEQAVTYEYASSETAYGKTVGYGFALKVF